MNKSSSNTLEIIEKFIFCSIYFVAHTNKRLIFVKTVASDIVFALRIMIRY